MNQIACLAIIKNQNDQVLAVKQIKSFGKVLFFPGGKIEENESCRECLKREVLEELGIEINVGKLRAFSETSYDGKDMLNLYYESTVIKGKPCIQEKGKHKTVKYIPIEDIYNYDIINFFK